MAKNWLRVMKLHKHDHWTSVKQKKCKFHKFAEFGSMTFFGSLEFTNVENCGGQKGFFAHFIFWAERTI